MCAVYLVYAYTVLNMELDLQSLFGLHVHSCTNWLRHRNPCKIDISLGPLEYTYQFSTIAFFDHYILFVASTSGPAYFQELLGLKYLKSFMRIRIRNLFDPGSGIKKILIRIRDTGIKIPLY
jgi:hypothetical protein